MRKRITTGGRKWLLFGLLLVLIIILILILLAKDGSIKYTYMTITGEWGESDVCGIDENQKTYCYIDNELSLVKQFYTEKIRR